MTREQRLINKGYKIVYLMGTCEQNRGKMKVMVKRGWFGLNKQIFTSVSAANKHIIGY